MRFMHTFARLSVSSSVGLLCITRETIGLFFRQMLKLGIIVGERDLMEIIYPIWIAVGFPHVTIPYVEKGQKSP